MTIVGDEHSVPLPPPPNLPEPHGNSRPEQRSMWEQVADAFDEWREGQAPADDLVRLMTPVLWHVARACRLDEDAARDVIQTVWLALVRRRGEIKEPRAVASWLITSTRRAAWHARSASDAVTKKQAHVPLEGEWDRLLPSSPGAETLVLQRDEAQELWLAVGTLPERCQRLLRVIAFYERPDYAALSATLGMPIGSIGPTRGRCLDKLRTALVRPETPAKPDKPAHPLTLPPTGASS